MNKKIKKIKNILILLTNLLDCVILYTETEEDHLYSLIC